MSLWGINEYVAKVGTFTGTSGSAALTVAGNADLVKQLKAGDILYRNADGTGAVLTVLTVNSATSVTLTAPLAANLSGLLYKKAMPTWVKNPAYAQKVSLVSQAEAQNTAFSSIGIKTPGWNYVLNYTDQKNKARVKSEPLTVFKS